MPSDRDFFRIEVDDLGALLSQPIVRIRDTDAPLDITVYDADWQVTNRLPGVRSAKLPLPSPGIAYVEVSSTALSRYRLTVHLEIDEAALPGPLQEVAVIPLPNLGDPPFHVDDHIRHVLFSVDAERRAGSPITLGAVEGHPIEVQLIDAAGTVLRVATRRDDPLHEAAELDVAGLSPGIYLLRLGHAGTADFAHTGPLNVEVLPTLR